MKAHKSIQPVLEQLAKDKVGRMRDHSECLSMNFMDNLEVHYKYMRQIRGCSEALQKRGRTLGDCQNMLDMLRARVEKGENDYEQCNLGSWGQVSSTSNQPMDSPLALHLRQALPRSREGLVKSGL